MVQLVRHRQTKESATDRLHLNHRVTPRLHKLHGLLANFRVARDYDKYGDPEFSAGRESRWLGPSAKIRDFLFRVDGK